MANNQLGIGNIGNWQHFHILTAVASAKVVGNISIFLFLTRTLA